MSVKFVAVGAGVVSSVIGSRASKKAAASQERSAAAAQELQREQYEQTREDNAPFRERGNRAGSALSQLMGLGVGVDRAAATQQTADWEQRQLAIDPDWWAKQGYRREDDIENRIQAVMDQGSNAPIDMNAPLLRKFTMADRDADPVYQSGLEFGLSEGRNAVDNRFAAAGASLSGAALKALTRFGNDYASTKAGEARSRFVQDQDTTYNRLAGIAGTGQTATRDVNNAGANYASAAGSAIMGGGEARAAGYLGQANAFNTGASQAIGGYQNNELMKLIRGGGGNRSSFVAGGSPSGGFGTGYGYGEQDYGQYF